MSKKNKKMAKLQNINEGGNTISWDVAEYEKHTRDKRWYIIAGIIALALITFAIFTNNYLFALIIIISGFIIVSFENQEPLTVSISLEPNGVRVGKKFYEYSTFKDFSIIYKPSDGIKNLYFEYKTVLRPRLSIPLNNMDPIAIRNYLLKRLLEDLERTEAPFSENLAKTLKL